MKIVSKTRTTNDADEVVLALTDGPTPSIQSWEVVYSWTEGDKAMAIIEVEGREFVLTVEPLGEQV